MFGWELPDVRLLANEYARAGFYAYTPDIQSGDVIPLDFIQAVEPPLEIQDNLFPADKVKTAAVVPKIMGPCMLKHREAITRPLVDGFINTARMIPGINKIGAIEFPGLVGMQSYKCMDDRWKGKDVISRDWMRRMRVSQYDIDTW